MLFDKEYYFKYIKFLENRNFILIILYLIFFTFIGSIFTYFFNTYLFIFLGMFLGIFFSIIFFYCSQIKIEEMKMKLDIYNKLINL